MYPLPALRTATETLWSAVRERLNAGPASLEWDIAPPDVWRHEDLFVAQTCGWPLVADLAGSVSAVGTFDYTVGDGEPGSYRSVIVGSAATSIGELREAAIVVAAVNDYASLSGWISLQHAWPSRCATLVTGSHLASCRAVKAGRAHIASIDPVSWDLFAEFEPSAVAGLTVIDEGPRVPCLPIVVPIRHAHRVDELRSAFAEAVADPVLTETLRALRIRGFVARDAADYEPLLTLT